MRKTPLLDYLNRLETPEAREAFAVAVGTTLQSLRNVAYGTRIASAALATQIVLETKGEVTREVLRPKDWHRIWDPRLNHMVESGAILVHSGVAANGLQGDAA